MILPVPVVIGWLTTFRFLLLSSSSFFFFFFFFFNFFKNYYDYYLTTLFIYLDMSYLYIHILYMFIIRKTCKQEREKRGGVGDIDRYQPTKETFLSVQLPACPASLLALLCNVLRFPPSLSDRPFDSLSLSLSPPFSFFLSF
jgi:hypothetical protein